MRVAWLPMRPETLKGHLDGMLRAALEPAPRHGYAIMEALRARGGGPLGRPAAARLPPVPGWPPRPRGRAGHLAQLLRRRPRAPRARSPAGDLMTRATA